MPSPHCQAKLCEDILLRSLASNFSEVPGTDLATLPAPLLRRLLLQDELDTFTEEQTLLATAPWIDAPARTAEEVAEALQGLRWAWLPSRTIGRLLSEGGTLAKFAEAAPVKDLIEKALSSKAVLKRARDEDAQELTW